MCYERYNTITIKLLNQDNHISKQTYWPTSEKDLNNVGGKSFNQTSSVYGSHTGLHTFIIPK